MTGAKLNNYSQVDTNILELQLTQDANFKGKHLVSLTNYDNTALPAIAAGSIVEVNGALFEFDTEEAIGGSPSNGTVYIVIIPSTTTCTAQFTNTAPTWNDSKQGFYGTGGSANYRYLEYLLSKSGTSWTKFKITYDDNILIDSIIANTSNSTISNIGTINISGTIQKNGEDILGFSTGGETLYLTHYIINTNTSGNGSTAHGLTNPATNNTIKNLYANSYITASGAGSTRYGADYTKITWDNTNITVTSGAVSSTYRIILIYEA